LALHDVSDPESKFDECYAALARAANKLRERMRTVGRRLPGSVEALAELAEHDLVQSVVTGNLEPIARTKLEVFGLVEHLDFEIGGYGSDGRHPSAAHSPGLAACAEQIRPDVSA
jgi:phosphoglycolate phosphatase-like HAD superfamily hydrolase